MTRQLQVRLPSEEEMRRAIRNRDSAYDSLFLYGVITTGVFCLPSCGARPARPENLRFFFDPQSAIAAGLRECKRCQPLSAKARRDSLINTARFIAANADQPLTLQTLATQAGLPKSILQRRFCALFGVSPKTFQAEYRRRAFKSALGRGAKVTDAIYDAGFGSTSRVYGVETGQLGMPPASYRAGGAGEQISYVTRNTCYGWLMIAATDQGLCFAQFGDGARELLAQLQEEFCNATLTESSAQTSEQLTQWLDALAAYLAARAPRPDLPLDLRGPSFQIQVWKFLLQIPAGQTASYSEVARGIGRSSAVRATASACAANRIAVMIPCHRVLRGDGSPGGYRWGTQRKQRLLERESQDVNCDLGSDSR